jgi:hypothetical protein
VAKEWSFMNDRLQKVFCAVVPSDAQVKLRVTESKTPEDAAALMQILARHAVPVSYQVFLANESDIDISDVDMSSGGFEGEFQLNVVTRKLGPLNAKRPY